MHSYVYIRYFTPLRIRFIANPHAVWVRQRAFACKRPHVPYQKLRGKTITSHSFQGWIIYRFWFMAISFHSTLFFYFCVRVWFIKNLLSLPWRHRRPVCASRCLLNRRVASLCPWIPFEWIRSFCRRRPACGRHSPANWFSIWPPRSVCWWWSVMGDGRFRDNYLVLEYMMEYIIGI